jgi:hypothetical protein
MSHAFFFDTRFACRAGEIERCGLAGSVGSRGVCVTAVSEPVVTVGELAEAVFSNSKIT